MVLLPLSKETFFSLELLHGSEERNATLGVIVCWFSGKWTAAG